MLTRIRWIVFGLLAVMIGLYPSIYFLADREFGLLGLKSDELLAQAGYNLGFYLHIVPGAVAMLTGWTQFIASLRHRRLHIHRLLGKIYVVCALIGGVAGLYISFYATGGWISTTGFGTMAVGWILTTGVAYMAIRKKDVDRHERMMVFSYALCFGAVTLRIWLPLLETLIGDFFVAYRIVSWLCWVPNVIFAFWLTRRRGRVSILR